MTTLSINVQLDTARQRPRDIFHAPSYREEGFLGRGMLGSVYKGTDGSRIIVVKVPNDADKYDEVDREYEILAAIHDELNTSTPPIPEVAYGIVEDKDSKIPALVMPYYSNDDLLLKKVRHALSEDQLLLAEQWAVQAAIAFCHAMTALKKVGYSCTDRKVSDFYLVDERHIIIDWNVVRESKRNFHIGEMRLFGYLWHEMFLQRKGQAPFQPFNDNRWRTFGQDTPLEGCLSVGLRLILNAAVTFPDQSASHPFATGGEPDFDLLRQRLEEWHEALQERPLPPNWLSLDDEQRRALEADLDYRLRRSVSLEARQQALEQAGGLDWATRIAQALEAGVSKAREVIGKAEAHILPEHKSRWEQLCSIAEQADFATSRYLLPRLAKIGQTLHSHPEDDQPSVLAALEKEFESIEELAPQARPKVVMLREESRLRQHAWKARIDLDQQISEYSRLSRFNVDHILPDGDLMQQIIAPYFKYLDDLLNSDDPSKIFTAYHLALALSRSDIEREWLKRQVTFYLETARCLEAYAEIRPEKVRPALPLMRALIKQWQAHDANHPLTKRLKEVVAAYEEHIRQAAENFVKTKPYALKEFLGLKQLYGSDLLSAHGFKELEDFYASWMVTYIDWAESPQDRSKTQALIRLAAEGEGKGWNMSDLLGADHEEVLKSLEALASEVREQARQVETMLQGFESKLGDINPKLREQLRRLREDVSASTKDVEKADDVLLERLKDAQRHLDAHERLAQLLRALETYNVADAARLMEELRQSGHVDTVESLQPYFDAVDQLRRDERVFKFYKGVKAQLEAGGTLSKEQYDYLAQEEFSGNSLVQELLNRHRLNQLQASMNLDASNFHQSLHEYEQKASDVRKKLTALRQRFADLTHQAIPDEIVLLDKLPLQDDEIIGEAVRSWRRRLVMLEEAFGRVEAIQKKLPIGDKPEHLEIIADSLRNLLDVLRTQDAEIFIPALHKSWSKAVDKANQALGELLVKNKKLSQEEKERAENFRRKIEPLKREADKKAELRRKLYPEVSNDSRN